MRTSLKYWQIAFVKILNIVKNIVHFLFSDRIIIFPQKTVKDSSYVAHSSSVLLAIVQEAITVIGIRVVTCALLNVKLKLVL